MVCKAQEYQVHHLIEELKDENFVMYYIKYILFYMKTWIDHYFKFGHTHDLDETGKPIEFEDWAVSSWEAIARDVAEVLLILLIIPVLLIILCQLYYGAKRLKKFWTMNNIINSIRRSKID